MPSALPQWMRQQIQEDLAPFSKKGLLAEDLDATIQNVYRVPSGSRAALVRYTIQQQKITVSSRSESLDDVRIAHVVEILQDLIEHFFVPDLDFLVSLWDSYDNPLYLENSHSPVFAICKKTYNRIAILYPEFRNFSYRHRVYQDIDSMSDFSPWDKKIDIAFWRGMTSGMNDLNA